MVNTCVVCGEVIPEGRMICPHCENKDYNSEVKGGDEDMIETMIELKTFQDVNDFAKLASKCADDVLVYNGRYIVSGKSILGLYSLDLSKRMKVEFYGEIPDEVKAEMKKYIVR